MNLRERIQNEPVAIRAAVIAVLTAVASVAGVNVEDPTFQWLIGAVTVAVNGWLIKSARDRVTPVSNEDDAPV